MREILLSKSFALISLSVIFAFNLLFLHFFSDSYVAWRSDKEIRNHKKDNELLIENMRVAENRITNIEEKIYTIVDYDNEMRDMPKMPRIHEDVRELGIGGPGGISEEKSVEIFEYLHIFFSLSKFFLLFLLFLLFLSISSYSASIIFSSSFVFLDLFE